MRLDVDVQGVNRSDLVALLEPGPQPVGALAEWLNQPPAIVRAALIAMAREQLVVQVGEAWALAFMTAPAPRRLRRWQRLPHQKPTLPANPPLSSASVSWWLDLSWDEFSAAARAQQPRMRASKMGRKASILES